MKRKPSILVDTFQLYYAMTGIGTYIRQLCLGLEEGQGLSGEYHFTPNWRKAGASTFFKGNIGFAKKILNHLAFFIWKEILLPFNALVSRSDFIVSTDFVGPFFSFKARNVIVIHDTFFWDFPENYPKLWAKYFFTLVRLGIKRDSIILATSEYTKTRILKVLNPPCPVEVLYQAPKITKQVKNESHFLSKNNLLENPYFLHVGIFDRRKNIQTIIRAFSIFRQDPSNRHFKLVLVGSKARGSYHDDYEPAYNLIIELELNDSVIMAGFLSDSDLTEVYHSAFAFIFPSLDEGFGIPVLEAFHAKIPLIISNRGALEEIANGGALIFDVNDPSDLAEKMMEIKSPALRNELVEKGLERLQDFSRDKFAVDLDRIIEKHTK